MYRWLVFLHVSGAFLFLLLHGTSAAVMFRLRSERSPAVLRSLLSMAESVALPFNVSLGIMAVTGIALGFLGNWWRAGWIWASIGLFLAISIVMSLYGRAYFERARAVLAAEPSEAEGGLDQAADDGAELGALLGGGRPVLLTVLGVGGVIIILWLMMFKAF